jgi:hypothetical protein
MRVHGSSNPLGAGSARPELETSAVVNVSLFSALVERLAEERRWVVLDLGAAQPQTIALLSPYRCRLDIGDIAEGVDGLGDSGEEDQLSDDVAALLPAHPGELTDIVFCWDFLNYMDKSVMSALMANIAARCRPGALVHALIAYSQPLMQQRPGQFVPIDQGHLRDVSGEEPSRIAPRYSTEDLKACMPDFSVDRMRLLGNGMQEYLFLR